MTALEKLREISDAWESIDKSGYTGSQVKEIDKFLMQIEEMINLFDSMDRK